MHERRHRDREAQDAVQHVQPATGCRSSGRQHAPPPAGAGAARLVPHPAPAASCSTGPMRARSTSAKPAGGVDRGDQHREPEQRDRAGSAPAEMPKIMSVNVRMDSGRPSRTYAESAPSWRSSGRGLGRVGGAGGCGDGRHAPDARDGRASNPSCRLAGLEVRLSLPPPPGRPAVIEHARRRPAGQVRRSTLFLGQIGWRGSRQDRHLCTASQAPTLR